MPCPTCGAALVRVRRQLAERAGADPSATRRFRCRSAVCGFNGLLAPRRAGARARAAQALRAAAGLRALVLSALALVLGLVFATGIAWLVLRSGWAPVDRLVHPGGLHRLAPGQHFEGDPVPGVQAAVWTPDAPAAAPQDQPLALRQHCIWGQPGRTPYTGTPEQALTAGRVPAELVPALARRIRNREVSDRVEIRREGLRTVADGREFSPRGLTLSFGLSMCLDSRVNFAPGHAEPADFYEVRDAQGRAHRVIVPDVCGNVSVLSADGARSLAGRWVAGAASALLDGLGEDGSAAQDLQAGHALALDTARLVPAPGTLGCVVAGLVALAFTVRRG